MKRALQLATANAVYLFEMYFHFVLLVPLMRRKDEKSPVSRRVRPRGGLAGQLLRSVLYIEY